MVNKIDFINQLSKKMGYVTRHVISAYLNVPYQPRGNRDISWDDFFGMKNLEMIQDMCAWQMEQLGYTIE